MDLLKMPGVNYCEFKKNAYLIRQGEKVDFLYYLASGTCYRTTITEKGDEIIYGIKESNTLAKSLVGVLILYSDGVSSYHFIARSKCCCYRVPKEVFFDYVKDKPELITELLRMAMGEIKEVISSFQARQEGKVANRLCEFLLTNAKPRPDGLLISRIHSNAEISRFLGIHKVTVAKIFRVLKAEGIVDKGKEGVIVLDQEALTSYARAEKIMLY